MPPARVPLWRDPVLIALVVASVPILGGFLLGPGGPRAQIITSWVVAPVVDYLLFVMARQVYRTLELPAHAYRFWRAVAGAGLLFTAGDMVQLIALVSDPGIERITFHPVQTACVLAGVLLICFAGLMPRRGVRTSREWTRILLDAAIVSSASGSVAWCLMTRPGLDETGTTAYLLALFGCALVLCTVFVVVRCGLSGDAPLIPAAAAPMVGATIGLAAGNVLLPSGSVTDTGTQMAMLLAPCLLVLAGPRIQLLRGAGGLSRRQWWSWASNRRYNLLPYAGTLVCAVVLIAVLLRYGLGPPAWGALAALLVNVGLVVGRQVLALAENNTLLGEIRNREQRLHALMLHSSEITSITGADRRFTYVSPAVEPILGVPAAVVLGHCSVRVLHDEDRARLASDLDHLYATPGAELTYQARYRHADGSWRWLEVVAANLTGEPGIGGVVTNSRDVTESRELHERLRWQAGHDELTGLANRRQFAAALAGRSGDATVLLIDLNGFKQINDTYGHAAGDAMLRHVTALLHECTDPDDLPARLGGDEFAVLAAGGADAGDRIAAGLRAALRRPAVIAGRELRPGASIGVATGPAGDPDHLLNTADLRMYEEKQRIRAYAS
ncbi:diguanylate cyclase domain-containing protein [Actinoplanes sp. G11-F43]|uniref:diguanylate cyclase domain-containing protein n=1 Tax=Actinoplanes sp. G11-F43 TaxID=3424130 RepID=UPI003D33A260